MVDKRTDIFLQLLFALLLVGLVYSKFLLSSVQFILVGLLGIFPWTRTAFLTALRQPLFWLLTTLYFFHILGIAWSSDLSYAWKDIRIKLPLLTMPVIFTSYKTWLKQKKDLFLLFFAAIVFTYMLYSSIEAFFLQKPLREILLLSHIRFSLMVSFALAIILYYAHEKFSTKYFILISLISPILSAIYLLNLASFTGYWSFLLVLFLLLIYFFSKKQKKLLLITGISFTLFAIYLLNEAIFVKKTFFPGYSFFRADTPRENGNPIYEKIDPVGIIAAWNKRSVRTISNTTDTLFHTLARYLASKGLPGNASGVYQLTSSDILAVENNVFNHLYPKLNFTQKRLYEIFWEWYAYLYNKQYSGHSFTQRLVLWQEGLTLFKQHWLFGVGTGDIHQQFMLLGQKGKVHFANNKVLRTHQQYLSIAIQLGFLGLLLLILVTVYPLYIAIKQKNILFTIFALLLMISMLYEDTLESQIGVSFFAIFTSFFLYIPFKKREK